MELSGKKVAILGLGIEGTALADFLLQQNAEITVFDKLSEEELIEKNEGELRELIRAVIENPKINKGLGVQSFNRLNEFEIVFRSPSVYFADPALVEAKQKGVAISSQIKLFFDLCPCPIIGVTGTKGKGTVSSLIFEILTNSSKFLISNFKSSPKSQIPNPNSNIHLAGNIGSPAITLIPKLKKEDFVILELSSFQLADLEKSPEIAVVTNIGIDHLDYHKDEREYLESKFNILAHQTEENTAILNADSSFDSNLLSKVRSNKLYFAEQNIDGADAQVIKDNESYAVVLKSGEKICRMDEIKLLGRHNLSNIAAAALAALQLDIPIEVIRRAVKSFAGLPHRLELAGEVNDIKFINDSFATNPGPTIAAIRSFDESKVLILGGSSKGADFQELAEVISSSNVGGVVLIGAEGPRIEDSLVKAHYQGKIKGIFKHLQEALPAAQEIAQAGDVIIFSPACASFDMFKNYKDRGDKFKTLVLNLSPNS